MKKQSRKRSRGQNLGALFCALCIAGLPGQAAVADAHPAQSSTDGVQDGKYDEVGSTDTNVADGFTMVAVGDLILSRPLTEYQGPDFDAVVKILRNADATFGNMESSIIDIKSTKAIPQADYGGAYHISVPELAPDLKAMGFNLVARANNHALDWGVEGMRETSRALDAAGIVYAGVGETLSQASMGRFLETKRGRVGLVSFASTFAPIARAADPVGEAPGRPGMMPLRLTENVVVTPDLLEDLKRVRDALPATDFHYSQLHPDKVIVPNADSLGTIFRAGPKIGYTFEPDAGDVRNILQNVRRAKQYSDFTIVTNHGHDPGNWSVDIPDYAQSFAHQLIDAGADAYVIHGPHRLRGIEIYKGRPILYSVGNFFYDDLRTPLGADQWTMIGKEPGKSTEAEVTAREEAYGDSTWDGFQHQYFYESIIAVSRFEKNQLAEMRLYPVELGYSLRFADRGIPRLASPSQARAILAQLQKMSEPFGTKITVEGNVGVIRLKTASVVRKD